MIKFKQSDLDELRDPSSYLSDVIIEFYFTYLSSIHPTDSILYVPPSISFLLSNSRDGDVVKDCLKPLELPSKNLIFFPVHGWKHWSLLVYHRESNRFVHHDSSMWGMNNSAARELYLTVKYRVHDIRHRNIEFGNKRHMDGPSDNPRYAGPQMQREENEYDCGSREENGYDCGSYVSPQMRREKNGYDCGSFICSKTPQQKNGVDCGLYVMAIAGAICRWFCEGNDGKCWIGEMNDIVDDSSVSSMRARVLELIRDASLGRLGPVSCTIEGERSVGVCSSNSDASRGLEHHDDIVRTIGGFNKEETDRIEDFSWAELDGFSDDETLSCGTISDGFSDDETLSCGTISDGDDCGTISDGLVEEGENACRTLCGSPPPSTALGKMVAADSAQLMEEENANEKVSTEFRSLVRQEVVDDSGMVEPSLNCDSTSPSSCIVEENKPVRDVDMNNCVMVEKGGSGLKTGDAGYIGDHTVKDKLD